MSVLLKQWQAVKAMNFNPTEELELLHQSRSNSSCLIGAESGDYGIAHPA